MAEPTIRKGSRGAAVRKAQRRLKARYYDPGPADGLFGAKTEKAVKYYQLDRDLTADGVVGPQTWARLDPPTVKRGSSGDAVKLAQQLLESYGYEVGSIDGDFGPKTEQAVKKFQDDFLLEVDGIVGPETWAMLGS
jgi:peptidoglycan hydrolase-like protein with peptidoglycan-binding domain